jgi:hypothetical protein
MPLSTSARAAAPHPHTVAQVMRMPNRCRSSAHLHPHVRRRAWPDERRHNPPPNFRGAAHRNVSTPRTAHRSTRALRLDVRRHAPLARQPWALTRPSPALRPMPRHAHARAGAAEREGYALVLGMTLSSALSGLSGPARPPPDTLLHTGRMRRVEGRGRMRRAEGREGAEGRRGPWPRRRGRGHLQEV